MNISRFIGINLNRLKLGLTYYSMIMSTLGTMGIIKLALPNLDFIYLLIIFPFMLFGCFLIGLFFDKKGITTNEYRKGIEMYNREFTLLDIKNMLFQKEMFNAWIKALSDFQNGIPIDLNYLNNSYEKYKQNWKNKNDNNTEAIKTNKKSI